MWNFLLALGTGVSVGKTKTARRFVRPLLVLFLVSAVVCAFVYAIVVFKAVSERSNGSHVHAHSKY